jgi:hypothetical protein
LICLVMMVQNMNKRLKRGDIVKLKMKWLSGWDGYGVVESDQEYGSRIIRFFEFDPNRPDYLEYRLFTCVRPEVAKTRNPSKELVEFAIKVLSKHNKTCNQPATMLE